MSAEILWMRSVNNANDIRSSRADFSSHLRDCGFGGEQVADGALILSELMANAYEHGSGVIRIFLLRDGAVYTLRVEDDGPGFVRPASREEFSIRGRGLEIVEKLANAITIGSTTPSSVDVLLATGT